MEDRSARPAPPRADHPAGGRIVAWAGFIFGSVVSVVGNVLAARIAPAGASESWTPSLAAQIGAAVWPVALLLSVEALARIRWPDGWGWRIARYGGVVAVALGSATISYGHIHATLSLWGYSQLGAGVGPLVIDGLMVVSGFALLADRHQGDDEHDGGLESDDGLTSDVDRARQLVRDADANGFEVGRPRLRKALGVTDHRAKMLLKQIRREQEVANAEPAATLRATNGNRP